MFSSILIGITGVFLLGIGLAALGLTSSHRQGGELAEVYARIRQMEWVVAFIFIPLGMWFVRMTVVRLSKPKPEE